MKAICASGYGGYDKWQEEVEEQFVWPGRPALLPDGRLCVPEGRHDGGRLQIVVPAEEIKSPTPKTRAAGEARRRREPRMPRGAAPSAPAASTKPSQQAHLRVVASPGGAVFSPHADARDLAGQCAGSDHHGDQPLDDGAVALHGLLLG